MHEMSIVQALVKQCEQIADEHNAEKILEVHVKIGVLSGVEPHFFQSTFEAFKLDTICKDAKLVMDIQKVKIVCDKCGKESTLEENEFLCPQCQSEDVRSIGGEDMMLMRLEME